MKLPHLFSLKSIIAFGFGIAIIPLLAAVLYAVIAMRETAALGRNMDAHVFEQTKTIRLVLQKTADIERKARLFVLLADPALRRPYERKSYDAARASFKQALGELLELPLDNKIALLANELTEKEELIYQQIVGSEAENHPKLPADEAFLGLREASNTLSREFESHIDREFNTLRQQSESREQALLSKVGALLGFSVVFVGILLAFWGRSMRQLDSSISRLGSGNLANPIHVAGPSDLRRLGGILESLRTRLLELDALKQSATHDDAGTALENIRVGANRHVDGNQNLGQENIYDRIVVKPRTEPDRQEAIIPLELPLADEA